VNPLLKVPPACRGNRTHAVPLAKRGEPTEGGNCKLWRRSWYYTTHATHSDGDTRLHENNSSTPKTTPATAHAPAPTPHAPTTTLQAHSLSTSPTLPTQRPRRRLPVLFIRIPIQPLTRTMSARLRPATCVQSVSVGQELLAASKPILWAKGLPVSLRWRWTKPVFRARVLALCWRTCRRAFSIGAVRLVV
jgi:hypothetical protein